MSSQSGVPLPQTTYTGNPTAVTPPRRHSPPPTSSYLLLTSPPIPHHPPFLGGLSLSLPPSSFILTASPLLFHPRSARIALVHDTSSSRYFLPRGRKDVGESLSTCALREGFEESGFRGQLINWGGGPGGTLQPRPPGSSSSSNGNNQLQPENKEAFWVQAQPVPARNGGIFMYFTYYFLAVLPEDDPVPDKDKGRLVGKHERGYEGILVPVEEAIERLSGGSGRRGRREDSLVFVADEDKIPKVSELIRSGKVWKEGGPGGEWEDEDEDVPAWESDNVEGGEKDVWKSDTVEAGEKDVWKAGPVGRESDTIRIGKDTADRLAAEGKGRFVPCPVNGGDDKTVQARVVYEGWKRLQEVYGRKRREG